MKELFMAGLKPETLSWVDQIETIRALGPNASRADRKKALNLSDALVTNIIKLEACFDPTAVEKVRQAAQTNPPFILSSNSAKALSGLKKAKAGDVAAFHAALDVTLTLRLAPLKIKALVEWMIKGNTPDTFKESETGKKTKTDKSTTGDKSLENPAGGLNDNQKMLALFEKVKAELARGDGQTIYQDELKNLLEKGSAENQEDENSGKKGKAGKKSKSAPQNNPSLFWEWMLGVKFMSQLKSKAKKGELTGNDKFLILVDKGMVKPLGWVFENFWKLLKKMAIGLWHSVEEAAGKTVKKILAFVLPLLFIIGIIWAILAFFHFAVIGPLHWIESKVRSGLHWGESKNAEPATPVPVTSSLPPQIQAMVHPALEKKIKKTAPQVYQPAVSFQNASSLNPTATLYDPKILESEIQSLPANYVLVKDYSMTPDEGMPGDVAVSRMQDITDPDKYTMMIGSSKQIITAVNPTNTTLTIQYKSTDPFGGFLDGSKSPMNFLWEDVKYIHTNEIDILLPNKPARIIYQCSLVVSGSKNPLTLQCASAEDLEHLVSTMQYFIRNSRLGHDTTLAGMPYPHQGLRLNDQCLVEVLWANSPVDKAGLTLGNMVWSLEKNTSLPPDREKLESQLSAMTSGPHDLYIVSPADRDAGLVQMNANHTNNFDPKRQKFVLAI